MKYIFTVESPTILSESQLDLLQEEFKSMIIKKFKEGLFETGTIRNARTEQ